MENNGDEHEGDWGYHRSSNVDLNRRWVRDLQEFNHHNAHHNQVFHPGDEIHVPDHDDAVSVLTDLQTIQYWYTNNNIYPTTENILDSSGSSIEGLAVEPIHPIHTEQNRMEAPPPSSGYGRQSSGYGRQGSGYGRHDSGYGRQGSSYGQEGSGYGRQSSGYGRHGSDCGGQSSSYGEEGSGYGRQSGQAPQTSGWTANQRNFAPATRRKSTERNHLPVLREKEKPHHQSHLPALHEKPLHQSRKEEGRNQCQQDTQPKEKPQHQSGKDDERDQTRKETQPELVASSPAPRKPTPSILQDNKKDKKMKNLITSLLATCVMVLTLSIKSFI